jgi:hypothetical protein
MAVGAAHIIMDQIRLLDKDALRWKELGGLRSFHTNLQKYTLFIIYWWII